MVKMLNKPLKTLLIPLCLLFSIGILQAQETKSLWTEADRQYTLDNMRRTRDALIKETENLTPAQWAFRDSANRWSIGEVVEHLALWEIIWAREIGMGVRNKPQPELVATSSADSYYTTFIMEDKPHTAPDFAVPTGYMTGKDNLTFFLRGREQAIKFVETTKADLRAHFELTNTKFPRNMHQVLIYQWGHVDRHLKQIAKLKAHNNYPKATDIANEEGAIKAAITAETATWLNRDSIGYMGTYVNEPISQRMWNNSDGSFGGDKNFSSIKNSIGADIRANPQKGYESKVERTDWVFKSLNPEWSWVNFIQKLTAQNGQIYTSYESRLLKKEGSKWKLVVMNALWDYKNVGKQ
jgi:hypothetical protein